MWYTVPLWWHHTLLNRYTVPFAWRHFQFCNEKLAITTEMAANALPDGWLIRVSRSKGKVYYYNTRTKETRWTRPTAIEEAGRQTPAGATGSEAAATAEATADEQADREATQKRQRTDAPTRSDTTTVATKPLHNSDSVKAGDVDNSVSKTRAMIAMSMRVGGSAFVARQSSFGTLANTQHSKPRAAFTPWDHQLEAIEGMIQKIQAQDADAKAKVCCQQMHRFGLPWFGQHAT